METLELLHAQVSKLSDKVQQLMNHVGNIQATCTLRHNVDLNSEIQKVSWQVTNLEQRFGKQELLYNQGIETHKELDDNIDEIKTVIDSIKLRVSNLQKQVFQKQQRYFTIKSQIFITVIGAIILSILTALGSIMYDKLFNSNNENIEHTKYVKRYHPMPQQQDNKK